MRASKVRQLSKRRLKKWVERQCKAAWDKSAVWTIPQATPARIGSLSGVRGGNRIVGSVEVFSV